jgi:hypothetical protein
VILIKESDLTPSEESLKQACDKAARQILRYLKRIQSREAKP